jgi:ring-1,2-phenylacetyl-CoA epoxidase subunit PaaB
MSDTQWPLFEVFHQSARGEPHVHVGSVHAPDAEMALVLAKEQFARRQSCVSLWVVPVEAVSSTRCEDSDVFERYCDKSYRESWGYKTPKTVASGSHDATEPASQRDE